MTYIDLDNLQFNQVKEQFLYGFTIMPVILLSYLFKLIYLDHQVDERITLFDHLTTTIEYLGRPQQQCKIRPQ
jgi:hypothetical protein